MKHFLKAAGMAIAMMTVSLPAEAALINWFSTGVDDNGAALATSATDSHWTINGVNATVMQGHNRYLNPTSPELGARWIGLTANGNDSHAPGNYVFETRFDLTGHDISTAEFSFDFASDNHVSVFLNNTAITDNTDINVHASYSTLKEYIYDPADSLLLGGLNSLTFVVNNAGSSPNPMALLVSGLGGTVTAVPVPAALPLLATALAGIALLGRRRKQRI